MQSFVKVRSHEIISAVKWLSHLCVSHSSLNGHGEALSLEWTQLLGAELVDSQAV
jgi:hypothetical protein